MVDRHGARWIGASTCCLAGLSIASLYWAEQLWQVYLLFGLSGIAGFGVPAGSQLSVVPVSKWFVRSRARAIGISTAGGAAGVCVAIPLAAYLIDAFGWRAAWMASGIFMLAVVVPAYALFMRREPEDFGLLPDGATRSAHDAARNEVEPEWTLAQAVRMPVLWVLVASQAAIQFALAGILFHRVSFFEDQGLSSTLVAWGIAADPFIVTFSTVIVGFLAHRVAVQKLGFFGATGWAISLFPMLFFVHGQGYLIFVHSIVWATAAAGSIAFTNLVWPTFFGRRALGAIRGAVLPVAVAAGALAAPTFGYLIDATSYEVTLVVAMCLFVGGGVTYLFTRPPGPRSLPALRAASPVDLPGALVSACPESSPPRGP